MSIRRLKPLRVVSREKLSNPLKKVNPLRKPLPLKKVNPLGKPLPLKKVNPPGKPLPLKKVNSPGKPLPLKKVNPPGKPFLPKPPPLKKPAARNRRPSISRKKIKEIPKQIEFNNVNNPTVILPTLNTWKNKHPKDYAILINKIHIYIRKQITNKLSESSTTNNISSDMITIIQRKDTDIGIIISLKRKYQAVEIIDAARKALKDKSKKTRSTGRETSRLRDIKPILSKNDNIDVYVDIGASEGDITKVIKNYLNPKEVYAFDIEVEEKKDEGIVYLKNEPDSLDRPTNSCDLVTSFMTLHHMTHLTSMLREIKRILKPGGKFIIRDHDTTSIYLSVYFDITHLVYSTVVGDENTPEEFVKEFRTMYKTKEKWIEIIKSVGFKLERWIWPEHKRNTGRSDVTNAFYALFINPE